MALLGRRREDDDDERGGGEGLQLDLEDRVCPTCGREVQPWLAACPDDGSTPVDRSTTVTSSLPDIPAHLLDGLDDEEPAPDPEEGDDAAP